MAKGKDEALPADAARMPLGEDYPEIREAIRAICAGYPATYWRQVEDQDTYPEAFVAELTRSGYLAALIPEEYGGSGLPLRAGSVILEEIHASGCNAGAALLGSPVAVISSGCLPKSCSR